MKLFSLLATLLAVLPTALALEQRKAVIVWFEDDTVPDSVYEKVKTEFVDLGSQIEHEYVILRGFAAKASMKALESVRAQSDEHSIRIEEDQTVSAN